MSFATDKTAILEIIKAKDCIAANYVYDNAIDYPTLADCFWEFDNSFNCDPDYLRQLADIIADPDRVSAKIYKDYLSGSATDAKVVIDCTLAEIKITSTQDYLEIWGGSIIDQLTIQSSARLKNLVVAGGALVKKIWIDAGGIIDSIYISGCGAYISEVSLIENLGTESIEITKDDKAIFGGYYCDPAAL